MKRFLVVVVVFMISLWGMVSCGGGSNAVKVSSAGAAFEVLVVSSPELWRGPAGDTVKSILIEPVPLLNQKEPMFDPVYMLESNFKGVTRRYRNILAMTVSPTYDSPSIGVAYDVYAQPQIVLEVSAPDVSSMVSYMWEHRTEIQKVLKAAEMARFVTQAKRKPAEAVIEKIEEKFDFYMAVPYGYAIRDASKDNFLWSSFELPLSSLGIVIYSYPYTGKQDFEQEALLRRRNEFMKLIPGEPAGSYMTTSAAYEPEVTYQRTNGRFWARMQGLWDVEGDIMGGPFVSFSTIDVNTNRVVCIDNYVYFPNNPKRNYLAQLESFVRTVNFPGDDQARAAKDKDTIEVIELEPMIIDAPAE